MFEDIRLNRSTLIIFLAIPALWLFFGYIYAEQRVQNLTANKYSEIANEMNNELQTLIQEKTETILIMAMSISNNPQIKNVLLTKTNKLELDEFSKELSETTTLKNIWFQVISADGTSLYRSWTKKHGDNLKEIRIDIREMIQNPKISSSISTGKFDLSFKSMVPLYNEGKFIGIVEVIAKFNSIAIKMERKGYDPVILVDKSYKNQLTKAFTKTFIKDYYVANLNAKKDLLTHIEEEGVSAFINKDKYFICDNNSQLISVYKLEDIYGKNMSYFYHFHDLNKIDLSEILYAKEKIFIFVFSVFIGIIGIYFYIYTTKYKQFVQKINTKLSKEVTKKTKEIHHIANHDDLTKLPNRVLFSDRLKQSIKHSKRDKKSTAILFLDLDRFKEINDTYGHQVGDKLLQEVAVRLRNSVREGDTVARLGGDEFTITLEDINDTAIIQIASNILLAMSKVFIIEQTKIFTTFSIGVSRYPQDAQDCDTLLRNADTAMYKAKEMGKNQYQFYDPKMTELAVKRASIEHDLRLALKNNELEPYFQVKIDALNEKTIGIESLVRWNHPTLGLIMPDTFISIAESTGLIFALDELIMEKSIQQVQKWQEEGLDVGTLSLNVCIRHLEKEDYIDTLQSILSKYNYDPKKLEIEITETQVMKNPDKTIKTLQKIRDLNVHISIDDFGTGYSSLSYLKRFPIDKLKIDRSFTQDLPDDKNDVAIVKTIIAMAKNLDINLLAEGVETKEQRDFLLQEGCQNMQGYYYSKPLAANEYKKFIQRYQ